MPSTIAAWMACWNSFRRLADEYLEHALRGEMHGFSNVSETLSELHQGINKSHPCGAGIGLVGVGPCGDISPCHRFTDSDPHALGHISTGIDRAQQADFLKRAAFTRNMPATPAGPGRFARAAVITRPLFDTAIRAIPISVTAIGFAAGRTSASRSMAQSLR